MTVLILSLWAFGVLLLIAFAVYRGRRAPATQLAQMGDFEITELARKVRVAASSELEQQILRDPVTGNYKVLVSRHLGRHSGVWKSVPSDGKPSKGGVKGVHVHVPKPGRSVL